MTNFELIQNLLQRVKEVENDLKYLQETSEPVTSSAIDKSIEAITGLYMRLLDIDKALEDEKTGYNLF